MKRTLDNGYELDDDRDRLDRAVRDALRVVTASYEYHGGFRLRTLSA